MEEIRDRQKLIEASIELHFFCRRLSRLRKKRPSRIAPSLRASFVEFYFNKKECRSAIARESTLAKCHSCQSHSCLYPASLLASYFSFPLPLPLASSFASSRCLI